MRREDGGLSRFFLRLQLGLQRGELALGPFDRREEKLALLVRIVRVFDHADIAVADLEDIARAHARGSGHAVEEIRIARLRPSRRSGCGGGRRHHGRGRMVSMIKPVVQQIGQLRDRLRRIRTKRGKNHLCALPHIETHDGGDAFCVGLFFSQQHLDLAPEALRQVCQDSGGSRVQAERIRNQDCVRYHALSLPARRHSAGSFRGHNEGGVLPGPDHGSRPGSPGCMLDRSDPLGIGNYHRR